mgnify:CR=1 FL=1
MKLNVKAFGLACGLLWGFGLFCLTWWIIAFDGQILEPTLLGRIYRGYTITPLGSVIGLAYGFFDALAGGAVFAWIYNKLASRM